MKQTTLYVNPNALAVLKALAQARNYIQSRGPGAGTNPSVSHMINAIAAGELVVLGPVPRWRDVTSGIVKALDSAPLTDEERAALETILRQVRSDADFDADD